MRKQAFVIGLTIIFFLPFSNLAQSRLSQKERRADKHLESQSFYRAGELYKKVIKKTPTNERAKLKLARTYFRAKNVMEAEEWYSEIINKRYLVQSIDYLQYAQILQSVGKITKAKKWAHKYLTINPRNTIAQNLVFSLENINQYYQDSNRYLVKELSVNTTADEFSPMFYKNGLVFVSSRSNKNNLRRNYSRDNSKFLNLYYTEGLIGGELLTNPEKLKGDVNNKFHQGPAAFFMDNSKIVYTSNDGNTQQDSDNLLNLYVASYSRNTDKWANARPLPINQDGYSTGHPSFDESQNLLYFVSDRPGGLGGTDLYKVEYSENRWGKPVNLGPEINSPGDEVFPYVDNNNRLYFSSNGRGGIGGLDIFYIDLTNSIGEIRNLGFPINSAQDDFGIISNPRQKLGYFSSDRGGKSDLYQFNETASELMVIVRDQYLEPVYPSRISLKSNGYILEAKTTKFDGRNKFSLTSGKEYELVVESTDHEVIHTSLIAPSKDSSIELTMNPSSSGTQTGTMLIVQGSSASKSYVITDERVIEVKEPEDNQSDSEWLTGLLTSMNVKIEQTVEINPVLYGFDKSSIDEEYTQELDKLADLMKRYDFIKFELGAHTDAIGSDVYNQKLSQRRAKSALEYLKTNEIELDRLLAVGYGESKPVNTCKDQKPCGKYQQRLNRRTEFKLIYMDENQVVSNY